ncbi:MAG: GDP-mannose 4,6-dehydratase [Desulfohalobiaceae bacterium]|nr:GDP-mannose 4,6-dehydratase [Desulfohalobiaceae bacterium]
MSPNSSLLTPHSSLSSPNSSLLTPHFWLITGGCGFIGSSLVSYLLEMKAGLRIRILDNLSVGGRKDLVTACGLQEAESIASDTWQTGGGACELVAGDIQDPEACFKAAQGAKIVVHLAANTGVGPSVDDPRGDMQANVLGTLNMLEAARHSGAQKFIFASSGAPVGEVSPPIHEELAPHPVSPYGASKLAGEGYCSAYFRTYGLKTVALRFGNVYGPGSTHKSSIVAKFIKQALAGEACEIYGDGTQTRDFIYRDDLLEAILRSARADIGGEIFQIATSKEHSVNEVSEFIKQKLKKHRIPMEIIHTEPRLGDVQRNYSDTTKARNILGWTPKETLDSGLEKTVRFFLAQASS